MLETLFTFCAGIVGYIVFKKIKFPVPAMIGSMVMVGIYSVISDKASFPAEMKIASQIIAGTFIGGQIFRRDLATFPSLAKPIVILLLMLTANTFVLGWVFSNFFNIEYTTALLSSVSGGLTDMTLIGMDMGAESSIVAVMQLSRMTFVMLFFPTWIGILTRKSTKIEPKTAENAPSIKTKSKINWEKLLLIDCYKDGTLKYAIITLIVGAVGGLIGGLLNFPASVLTFSMVFSATLHCINPKYKLIIPMRTIAQLFAGTLIGCTITRSAVQMMQHLVFPIIILCASYILVNYVFGWVAKKRNYLDYQSALFASCPAGASDMALIAADLGADLTKIAVVQIVRLVYVIAAMPLLISLFLKVIGY
jgi:membrane protein AbrB duplication